MSGTCGPSLTGSTTIMTSFLIQLTSTGNRLCLSDISSLGSFDQGFCFTHANSDNIKYSDQEPAGDEDDGDSLATPSGDTFTDVEQTRSAVGSEVIAGEPACDVELEASDMASPTEGKPAGEVRIQEASPPDHSRILIGTNKNTGSPVYWGFGHPQLANRHLLITGQSGQGKTYLIQALILELARRGISSVIVDYTDGFTQSKLEREFSQGLDGRIVEFPHIEQFPINPCRIQDKLVATGSCVRQ